MKKFTEYLNENPYIHDDMEDIIQVVSDYLEDKADELERNEPYATKTINKLREAAYAVREIEEDEYRC